MALRSCTLPVSLLAGLCLITAGCSSSDTTSGTASISSTGPVHPAVQRAQAEVAQQLRHADASDFDDARRGFIAAPSGQVRNEAGQVIWDYDAFAFLQAEAAPDSVNPSLWRQARLNNQTGLFKVREGIWQLRGFDLSNITLIQGQTGWIVVDTGTSRETAAAALAFARQHLGAQQVSAVIYTHSHVDHFGGVRGVVSGDDVAGARAAAANAPRPRRPPGARTSRQARAAAPPSSPGRRRRRLRAAGAPVRAAGRRRQDLRREPRLPSHEGPSRRARAGVPVSLIESLRELRERSAEVPLHRLGARILLWKAYRMASARPVVPLHGRSRMRLQARPGEHGIRAGIFLLRDAYEPSVRHAIDPYDAARVHGARLSLAELDAHPDVDVIIIARGGGAFEDLLPFSDERLLRVAAPVPAQLLGSGELGKEVLIALQRLGVETIAVDRYEHAPGQQVAHHARTITMSDPAQLKALIEAVERMLPRGPLFRQILGNLRVYKGTEHPHEAQQPQTFDVGALNRKNVSA